MVVIDFDSERPETHLNAMNRAALTLLGRKGTFLLTPQSGRVLKLSGLPQLKPPKGVQPGIAEAAFDTLRVLLSEEAIRDHLNRLLHVFPPEGELPKRGRWTCVTELNKGTASHYFSPRRTRGSRLSGRYRAQQGGLQAKGTYLQDNGGLVKSTSEERYKGERHVFELRRLPPP